MRSIFRPVRLPWTEHGIQEAEKAFKLKNLYDIENTPLVHHINQALKSQLYHDP